MRWAKKVKLRRTTLIMLCLVAFLIGIVLTRTKVFVDICLIGIVTVFVCIVTRQSKAALMIAIALFSLCLGWWRGSIYMNQLAKYKPLYSQRITIIGQADTDGIYAKGSQLSFDIKNLQVISPHTTQLIGKVSVKGFGATAVYRDDLIKVTGKLYQTRGSRQASISYSQIEIIKRSSSVIGSARRKFVAGMYSALPEPLASFGLGLLIGQRSTLPETVNNQLSSVGLTHIVAVSGYNLTIIMVAVTYVLRGRSKYQSTLISVLLIGLFLLFTGFSASIVRAAIVGIFSLAAAYYGRSFRPVLLILLAACLTAGSNPIYIWSDIGWYLSFLAFFGVLVIAPLVLKRIYKHKRPKLLASVIAETMSAQLMALPLIMYIFGEVSLIALPANMLIVPLVPLAMLMAFMAALGGLFVPAVAGWLAWPARVLLTYMLDVIALMSKIPHALAPTSLRLTQLIAVYALILVLIFILIVKTKRKNATITEIITEE